MENEASSKYCCGQQFNCTHGGKCPNHSWRTPADGVSFGQSWKSAKVSLGGGTPLPDGSFAHPLDKTTPTSCVGRGPKEGT